MGNKALVVEGGHLVDALCAVVTEKTAIAAATAAPPADDIEVMVRLLQ
jgi:hypothetical protein